MGEGEGSPMSDTDPRRRRRSMIAAGVAVSVLVALTGWVLTLVERPAAPPPLGDPVRAAEQTDERVARGAAPVSRSGQRRETPRRARSSPTPAPHAGGAAQPVKSPDAPEAGDDDRDERADDEPAAEDGDDADGDAPKSGCEDDVDEADSC